MDQLPAYLRSREDNYPHLSAACTAIYDQWFASGVMFDRMIGQLAQLRNLEQFPLRGVRDRWYLHLAVSNVKGKLATGARAR